MPSPPTPVRPDPERLALLLEMTERLHRVTAHLSSALAIDRVATIVVDEGTEALHASRGALWLYDEQARMLRLVRAVNYSDEMLAIATALPIDPSSPVADVIVRETAVWISSRTDHGARYPASAARARSMLGEGYSIAALPIRIEDRTRGVLALTFDGERGFDSDERTFLGFLAMHCAQGIERARLYAEAMRAHDRALLAAKASELLGASLDYEETLRNVVSLVVPAFADACAIDLVDARGAHRRVAAAPSDLEVVALVAEPRDPRLRMTIAIRDRDAVIGAISFARREHPYAPDDVLVAEQLADRAGAAIANAKLYTEARDAIRLRDEFMLVAGHELRTPLSALSLLHESLEKLRDDTPLDKIRERGTKLRAQSLRLHRLVEDLLDVSRMSAGRPSLDREQVDLGALVTEIAERMRDELERAHSPLALDVESVVGHWDRVRLDQIITNLLGNALKYGRGSPIEARVRRDGDRATLVVVDRGIGIAPADHQRIFQRFERAASPRKFAGLGLGLWITSELVQAHGGAISVDSELGRGATFTVTLPIGPIAG